MGGILLQRALHVGNVWRGVKPCWSTLFLLSLSLPFPLPLYIGLEIRCLNLPNILDLLDYEEQARILGVPLGRPEYPAGNHKTYKTSIQTKPTKGTGSFVLTGFGICCLRG